MDTISSLPLPSFVIIGSASFDLVGHHNGNLKDDDDCHNESTTVTTLFASDDDYSIDDSESCVSEFSESTYNSWTSYIIELSGNYHTKSQQPQSLSGNEKETSAVKKLYRTKPRRSVQRRMNNNDGGDNYESDEDSVKLLRHNREFHDSNYLSWSDKVLETMEDEDVDSIIVPLEGDSVEGTVEDYYQNHIVNKDSDNVEFYSNRRR